MNEYAAWLIAELEAVGEPVDLVGHDWGGILTSASHRSGPTSSPDGSATHRVRSTQSFTWHELAKIWQTPDAGEEFMAAVEAMSVPDAGRRSRATACLRTRRRRWRRGGTQP